MSGRKRAIQIGLFVAAGLVLWYLGHFLLAAVWMVAGWPAGSSYSRLLDVALLPLAFGAAWLLLVRRGGSPG